MRNYILQNFPFLEDDFDALTDYQLFCKMVAYMRKTSNKVDAFEKELKEFENYFNNLDVQDEIDNKLDEMYENGELATLITDYLALKSTYTYNTVAEMKIATNLAVGAFTKTLGFYNFNDGGGAYYKIREINEDEEVDNITTFSITGTQLVAELIKGDSIDLKQLGADSLIDATDIIQLAIDNFKTIYVNDDYFVSDTLLIDSKLNLTFDGTGSIIISHDEEKDLFNIVDSDYLTFNNINVGNDVKHISNASPLNKYVMLITNCNHLEFNNFRMTNAYNKGIDIKKCGYANFVNCYFKDCYYDMLTILTECHDILVDNCVFDTTGCTYTNSYLLCTGSGDYSLVDYMCKNITIRNSKFLNNPTWEGIDSHGCENLVVENNYVENCLDGISIFYDERQLVNYIANSNITVRNNVVKNTNGRYGITVNGGLNAYSSNVIISDNKVIGYSQYADTGSISVTYLKNFKIINNFIDKADYYGIRVFYSYKGDVNNNVINLSLDVAEPTGIRSVLGNWLLNIKNNIINNSYIGVWNSGRGLSMLDNNICLSTYAKYYTESPNATIIGAVGTSANRVGCKGIYTVDDNDLIKSYCTDSVIRSVATTLSGIKCSGSANSNVITCDQPIYNYLCIGQEIVLNGAGSGGANLTTTVLDVIGINEFLIKDNLSSNISNLSPVTTDSTWSDL